jgi:hypothetical protein
MGYFHRKRMSHSLGKQFGDLTVAVCSSGRRKRHDVIKIAEYPFLGEYADRGRKYCQ